MRPVLDGLQDFRLLVASLPGHDPQQAVDFTTVSEVADDIAVQIPEGHVDYGLGFSIGGMILAEMVSRRLVSLDRAILDSPSTQRSALVGWVMRRLMAVEVRNRLAGRPPRLPVLPHSAHLYADLSPASLDAVLRESFGHHLPAAGLPRTSRSRSGTARRKWQFTGQPPSATSSGRRRRPRLGSFQAAATAR
jgi:pimeloyl-ACP methyl ester carboxylesterase